MVICTDKTVTISLILIKNLIMLVVYTLYIMNIFEKINFTMYIFFLNKKLILFNIYVMYKYLCLNLFNVLTKSLCY